MKRSELHLVYREVLALRYQGLTMAAIGCRVGKTTSRVGQILRHEIDREKQIIDEKVNEMTGPHKVQFKTENISRYIVCHFPDDMADELLLYLEKKITNVHVWDFRKNNDCFDRADRAIAFAKESVVRYKYKK